MSNPYPTKSKPAIIGRKHTGAPSVRQRGRIAAATHADQSRRAGIWQRYRQQVAAFYRGEIDQHPRQPVDA